MVGHLFNTYQFQLQLRNHFRLRTSRGRKVVATEDTMSFSPFCLYFTLLLLITLSSSVLAVIPQSYRHTNLLRTIDLTKPYIRDSTALILENTSNTTQSDYYWGIPLSLVPKLSYLEVKEKKTGSAQIFPVEHALEDHAYISLSVCN